MEAKKIVDNGIERMVDRIDRFVKYASIDIRDTGLRADVIEQALKVRALLCPEEEE